MDNRYIEFQVFGPDLDDVPHTRKRYRAALVKARAVANREGCAFVYGITGDHREAPHFVAELN